MIDSGLVLQEEHMIKEEDSEGSSDYEDVIKQEEPTILVDHHGNVIEQEELIFKEEDPDYPDEEPKLDDNRVIRIDCNECAQRFVGVKHLVDHKVTVHNTKYDPLVCVICRTQFITKHVLSMHMRKHTREDCSVCGKNFSGGYIARHMHIHTNETAYQCKVCSKGFFTWNSLQIHLAEHTGKKPFSCNKCNKSFIRSSQLNTHLRSHTGEKPYVCVLCNARFTTKTWANYHMMACTAKWFWARTIIEQTNLSKIDNHMCTIKQEETDALAESEEELTNLSKTDNQTCTIKQEETDALAESEEELTNTEHSMDDNNDVKFAVKNESIDEGDAVEPQHVCKYCDTGFNNDLEYIGHMREHTNTFNCIYCDYSTRVWANIENHSKNKHFNCEYCRVEFANKKSLSLHQMRVHKVLKKEQINCKRCHQKLPNKRAYEKHLCEIGAKSLECYVCWKEFSTLKNLYAHLKRMHQVDASCFICKICDKKFTSMETLQAHSKQHMPKKCLICNQTITGSMFTHLRLHKELRPYKCSNCKQRFTSSTTWKNHELDATHTRPFKCAKCDLTFTYKCALNKHNLVHKCVKPYVCTICTHSFAYKTSIRKHYATIHAVFDALAE